MSGFFSKQNNTLTHRGFFGARKVAAAPPSAHQFVAVGTNANRPFDTTGFITIRNSAGIWTPISASAFGAQGVFSVAHATGQWLAGSSATSGSSIIATSPDANIWTPQTNPLPGMDMDACGGDGALGVFGGNTADLLDSPDGISWTDEGPTFGGSAGVHAIAASGAGIYVVVAGTSGSQSIAYNTGSGWNLELTVGTNNASWVIWDGTQFIAIDAQHGTLITSSDGPNWTTLGSLTFNSADHIAFNGHVYVLTSQITNTVATAPTLAALLTATDVPFSIDTISSIVSGGGLFVAVDFSDNAYSSTDGGTWVTESIGVSPPNFPLAIAYA